MKWLLVFCLGWSAFAVHAGEAHTVRPTEVKAKPFADAATLSSLPENSPVEVLARKSGWMQIRHDNTNGWVKMLNLRLGNAAAQKKSGDSGLGKLFNVAATGASGSTVSTGVRGLSEENLRNPNPNPQALAELQHYAASEAEAQKFGESGKLATQRIDYLPAPAE
ncbi:MAG: hypothetical protein A3F73_06355 [Gallionellales bacterium RIFCSPLOWO2_12_FULL_59_22]|nr:MAG: hypothetical protein A3H99_11240 [Gallionellales bacterium RIFCSPLOWO2_02_FULL_59_110]OGT03064.1 MAG: hypothetical protein A2Z65_02735 [Gallionellales bacterium RIFCSPLOWO2_02_58_13]OGT13423.1 MAG: hypothetical protein A3F73_06355 [Gallionellales bacterium RIFCSPLOWO2_12_FULL_59_22]